MQDMLVDMLGAWLIPGHFNTKASDLTPPLSKFIHSLQIVNIVMNSLNFLKYHNSKYGLKCKKVGVTE